MEKLQQLQKTRWPTHVYVFSHLYYSIFRYPGPAQEGGEGYVFQHLRSSLRMIGGLVTVAAMTTLHAQLQCYFLQCSCQEEHFDSFTPRVTYREI